MNFFNIQANWLIKVLKMNSSSPKILKSVITTFFRILDKNKYLLNLTFFQKLHLFEMADIYFSSLPIHQISYLNEELETKKNFSS